jgi:hypothetical protein
MTPEQNQKKRRFRELAKDDRIKIASRFYEAVQLFLPFDEFTGRVSQENRDGRAAGAAK